MKKGLNFFVFFSFVCFFLFACATTPAPAKDNVSDLEKDPEKVVAIEITSHKGTQQGVDRLPVWLETWFSQGKDGLESLPDYFGYNCFVESCAGSSLDSCYALAKDFVIPSTAHRVNDWWLCIKLDNEKIVYYYYLFYIIPKSQ